MPPSRDNRIAIALLTVSVVGHLVLLHFRHTATQTRGDEGTYLAMTESLALDGDLVFDESDRARLEAIEDKGRQAVILQQFDARVSYSKPFLYPVIAALWFRFAGVAGLIALNVVAAGVAGLLARAYLRRQGCSLPGVVVATFLGTTVFMGYAAWTMSDSLQASMTLAGLSLSLAGVRSARFEGRDLWSRAIAHPSAPVAGVVLLAMVGAMRLPNLALAGLPILAWSLRARLSKAVLLMAVVALTCGSCLWLNDLVAGAAVPYKSVRATFNPASGYPAGPGAEKALEQFSDKVALARQRLDVVPAWDSQASAWSTLYFLVGRHSGLLFYFPMAVVLLLAGLRQPDAQTVAVIAAVGVLAAFYLVWMPENYFGGATFLGNRYFLTGYMGLLFLPSRWPGFKGIIYALALALLLFASALASVRLEGADGSASQSHAHAGIFRLLPYETTARNIDGRRDQYWIEYFRFVDPFAKVSTDGFEIRSDRPAAEVIHASQIELGVIRFLARITDANAEIIYHGESGELVFPAEAVETGARALIEVPVEPAWRRHRYWFSESERPNTRVHRFSVRSADPDVVVRAELFSLSMTRLVPKFLQAFPLDLELPRTGSAGGRTTVPVRIRNTGLRFWASRNTVPTHLGYQFFSLPRQEGDEPVSGRLEDFDGQVTKGSDLVTELGIRWPRKPGSYELVVDLSLAGVYWFAEWNQEPLARVTVEVKTAS